MTQAEHISDANLSPKTLWSSASKMLRAARCSQRFRSKNAIRRRRTASTPPLPRRTQERQALWKRRRPPKKGRHIFVRPIKVLQGRPISAALS